MPRVQGVDLPNDKPCYISLSYLYGIGKVNSVEMCRTLGIDPQMKAKSLTDDDLARINSLLDTDYVIEGQLRRQIGQNIQRLQSIHSYRGIRHRKGLPVRGQNTQTNARTRKGVRKTVAGKKGVKDMKH